MSSHYNNYHAQNNHDTKVSEAPPMMVDLQSGEIITHPNQQADEVVKVITTTNQQRYVIFISNSNNQEKEKSKWLHYIEKLTGWKIILFDSYPELPLLILDKEKRELYINRELLKHGYKEFITMVDKLVTLLTKQTAAAYQNLTNALHRIQSQRKESKAKFLLMEITNNGLKFPADFSLQASDLHVSVISVDNELIIKTANFRMIATVAFDLPLTVETTQISMDEHGFILPLERSLFEKLASHSELPFTVEYSF